MEDLERVDVDILAGQSRTPQFLEKNANGRVPVLELEDSGYLSESDAILWYLAETREGGARFLPADPYARAQVLRWMFFEQYSHEPYIATVRFWIAELGQRHARFLDHLGSGEGDVAVTRDPPREVVDDLALGFRQCCGNIGVMPGTVGRRLGPIGPGDQDTENHGVEQSALDDHAGSPGGCVAGNSPEYRSRVGAVTTGRKMSRISCPRRGLMRAEPILYHPRRFRTVRV